MNRFTDMQLIQLLWERQQRLAQVRDELATTYGWSVCDIRLSVFTKIENAVGSTALGFESMTEFLILHRRHRDGNMRAPIEQSVSKELAAFYKLGFIQFVFSAIESSLRSLLRALNPTAANNGTAKFKAIYDCLLRTELALQRAQDWVDMLDFFRLIRNTLHNNGVYFHQSGTDTQVMYRGDLYQFKHGQKIDFVYWDLCLILLDDSIDLLKSMHAHPCVLSLPSTKDPFAT
jgi:hypothetical protein